MEAHRTCRVAGVVSRLRLDPSAEVLEITIGDGSATLLVRGDLEAWARFPAVTPGTGLILEGEVLPDPTGTFCMIDPTLEVVPGPEFD